MTSESEKIITKDGRVAEQFRPEKIIIENNQLKSFDFQ